MQLILVSLALFVGLQLIGLFIIWTINKKIKRFREANKGQINSFIS